MVITMVVEHDVNLEKRFPTWIPSALGYCVIARRTVGRVMYLL